LFYYSGHGSQATDPTNINPDGMDSTIVAYDSRIKGIYDIKEWEISEMLDELTSYGIDNVTVIMDCPHSNLKGSRQSNYVFLGAGNKTGKVYEHNVHEGKGRTTYGAMTYFLVQELGTMSKALTYRELHQRLTYHVNNSYRDQHPQCTGDIDREIFGTLRPKRNLLFSVTNKSQGFIWVDGGIAHGLTEGSQLQVYPPETRTLAKAGEPIALLSVEEVGAIHSGCIVEEGESNIPIHARAVVYHLNHGNMQRSVLLDIADEGLCTALQNCLNHSDVKLVEASNAADFCIRLEKNKLEIQDSTGRLLVAPFEKNNLYDLTQDMTHLVRYHNALDLSNTASHSELAGAVSVAVKQLEIDSETQQPFAKPIKATEEGNIELETGQRIVVEITNFSDQPLYFTVLSFSSDFSVIRLYPYMRGSHEQLAPGRTFSLGLSRKRNEQLTQNLAGYVSEFWEIKVIATIEQADFEILELPALLPKRKPKRI